MRDSTPSGPPTDVLWLVDHVGYGSTIHGLGMYLLNIIPAFDPRRFRIHLGILRNNKALLDHFHRRNIRNLAEINRGKYDPSTLFDLLSLCRTRRIALIHTHGYGANNFGRLVGRIAGVPAIIHTHDPLTYYPLIQAIADRLLAGSTCLSITVSDTIKELAIHKRKVSSEKTAMLPTCIPRNFSRPLSAEKKTRLKRELGIPVNTALVGSIGRLCRQKGMEFFIKAMPRILAEHPETFFLIVGDGPLRQKLENLCGRLRLQQKIRFTGHRRDIDDILSLLDIKVLASLWEGTPLALLEAMAMGKAIVATEVDGMQEVLQHDQTALLVRPGCSEEVAAAVCRLLAAPDLSSEIARNAAKESELYCCEKAAERIQELYARILQEERRTVSPSFWPQRGSSL